MILFRTFLILLLFIGMSCKKAETSNIENVVTVDLPEKIEFSPSGKMPDKNTTKPVSTGAPVTPIPAALSAKIIPQNTAKETQPLDQNISFRDPFLSYLSSESEVQKYQAIESGLFNFEIKNYKYVGFLMQSGVGLALIEDPAGNGYTLKVGSKIGRNKGRVESIRFNQIVIKEGQNIYTTLKLAN